MTPLAISIDGFEKIFAAPHLTLKVTNLEISKEKKYLLKICLIYINSFSKIDGFVEPSPQIDGFGRTHQTRANGATGIQYPIKKTIPVNSDLSISLIRFL